MSICYYSESVDLPRNRDIISKRNLRRLIEKEGFRPGDISVIFVTDDYLLGVNKKYLDRDYFTDVITFDYSSDKILSGDIFISTERVLENSMIFNIPFPEELRRVIIHGFLHLCGYQDDTERSKDEIRQKENDYLDYLAH